MLTVWAVEWGNEFPAEVDSLWTTKQAADARADEKNAESRAKGPSGADYWRAEPWVVKD